ncbi:hypothetical protein BT93_K1763 [Corymbia citriodora subsp. variegata]|nr:hypothetical protein BT93_K1763 [Corymbia citriodora subsp. variegata]
MSSAKKITIFSNEGESFEVDEAVVFELKTIKDIVEADKSFAGSVILNVTSRILAKVTEYCKKHVESKSDNSTTVADLRAWDRQFVKVDQATLFDLIMAANYMNIEDLLDLTCRTVAGMINGKTPEEVTKTFNIRNDFTPEEREKIRRKNKWVFE